MGHKSDKNEENYDAPDLQAEFVTIFNTLCKKEASHFVLLLGAHVLKITGTTLCDDIIEALNVNLKWLAGKLRFLEAKQVGVNFIKLAIVEKDPVKELVFRAMQQISATPHDKNHALLAADCAVTLINVLYPSDKAAIRKERAKHIELIKKVLVA
jgi:hypothetical protein